MLWWTGEVSLKRDEHSRATPRRHFMAIVLAALLLDPAAGGAQPKPAAGTGAVGQIVPAGGIIGIPGTPGAEVIEVHVRAGQFVKAGTLLMRTRAAAAEGDAAVAQGQLRAAQELAARQTAAQTLSIELARARNEQAQAAASAYRNLGNTLASKKELDALASAAANAEAELKIEQARLRVVQAQNDSNIRAARLQLDYAARGSELRAPVDGTVLKVTRRVGERLGGEPGVQMGDLSAMYVVCQLYEGDLLRLRPGMAATIRSPVFSTPLRGRVEEVGRTIDTQARLGEVRIRLDRADPASRLVGMQVDVSIDR
jgi:cobalt-zinc-cadmium efflux system membrane fusion protein